MIEKADLAVMGHATIAAPSTPLAVDTASRPDAKEPRPRPSGCSDR
jgi:hypothetical protein